LFQVFDRKAPDAQAFFPGHHRDPGGRVPGGPLRTGAAGVDHGAGGFLPKPLYERWAQMAREGAGIQLTYHRLGAAGLEKLVAREVDFAVADYPRRAAMLRENSLIQFPASLGAIVPFANLPGVGDGQLRLTGENLADIYLGKITRWNDPRLGAQNGELRLPDLPVTPVHRAGATAASYNFTTYLSRVSEAWAAGPRAATSVAWPAGASAEGNDGVNEKVRGTPGAIGYADGAFAKANQINTVLLKNRDGAFVKAGPDSYAKAAAAGDWSPANFITDMIDLDAPGAWPIVTPSLVLLANNPTAAKVQASLATMKFFDWAYRHGGEAAAQLGYVALPPAVHAAVRDVWRRVKGPDGKPLWEA